MEPNISFPGPVVGNSLMWTVKSSFVLLEKHMARRVAANALVGSGRVVWSKSVVGMTDKVLPPSEVLDHGRCI